MLVFTDTTKDISCIFYYDSPTNTIFGMGDTKNEYYIKSEQVNKIRVGSCGGTGIVNVTFNLYRLATFTIPSDYLSKGNSIPDGSGGRINTAGAEYRNPSQ